MRILISSTTDFGGGAEISAWNLFNRYRQLGYSAWLAVGLKQSDHAQVLSIPNDSSRSGWARLCQALGYRLGRIIKGKASVNRLNNCLQIVSEPKRFLERVKGYEDFNYPGTRKLLTLCNSPDVLHCFNLHGGYFDLRMLPWLSHQLPVILDLRDAWLLSGHCAHSFDCERWKIGCGNCPDLNIYPRIHRDATAFNWQRKRKIYEKSRLYVATPCEWLMKRVQRSILAPSIVESRIIPTGVDLSNFHSADKALVRAALKLPRDCKILLFAAVGVRRNMWKDFSTLKVSIAKIGERQKKGKILLLVLGEESPGENVNGMEVRFLPFERDARRVAQYFQAADVYLHAARAETFPRVVLEALACGTPVVASDVGGIPEQIKGLDGLTWENKKINLFCERDATGVLVPPGNSEAMAESVLRLLSDDRLLRQLSNNASKDAKERFDLERQVKSYVNWYHELGKSALSDKF